MIKLCKILSTKLVPQDVEASRSSLGPCKGCAIGEMTHQSQLPSSSFPTTQVGELVHMDIIYFHHKQYLFSIDDYSKFVILQKITDKTKDTVEEAIQKMVNIYTSFNFQVKQLRSDHEAVFVSCEDFIRSIGIIPSLTAPEHHEAMVERSVRTIKDKTRSLIFGLPYHLPLSLYDYAIRHVASCLNMIPRSGNPAITPNVLVTGNRVNVSTDLRASFGEVGLFRIPNAEKDDDMPRAELGIVVGRLRGNGILKVFVPSRNRVVSRYKFIKTKDYSDLNLLLESRYNDDQEDVEIEEIEDFTDFPTWTPEEGDVLPDGTVYAEDSLHLNLTILEAMKFDKPTAEVAITDELKQMINLEVWEPIANPSTISRHEIIPCHMILKMKYKADGSKDRMKARLVAGGNFEFQEDIIDNSSPTVDILTFMILISLLSYLKWEMQSIDVLGHSPKPILPTKSVYENW